MGRVLGRGKTLREHSPWSIGEKSVQKKNKYYAFKRDSCCLEPLGAAQVGARKRRIRPFNSSGARGDDARGGEKIREESPMLTLDPEQKILLGRKENNLGRD